MFCHLIQCEDVCVCVFPSPTPSLFPSWGAAWGQAGGEKRRGLWAKSPCLCVRGGGGCWEKRASCRRTVWGTRGGLLLHPYSTHDQQRLLYGGSLQEVTHSLQITTVTIRSSHCIFHFPLQNGFLQCALMNTTLAACR